MGSLPCTADVTDDVLLGCRVASLHGDDDDDDDEGRLMTFDWDSSYTHTNSTTCLICDTYLNKSVCVMSKNKLYQRNSFLRASGMLKNVIDIGLGWTSLCLSVCPSVCHTLALYQNG